MGYNGGGVAYTPEQFSLDQERLDTLTHNLAKSLAELQTTTTGLTNLKELFDV